ncbi:MAG: protein phosphatase 2C domain-containing protein [Paenisporosarcina sp.]
MSNSYRWVGSEKNYVDEKTTFEIGSIVAGHFGGCSTAGQYKNEDGCLVFLNTQEEWEFTLLLDAHNSAESADLVVLTFLKEEKRIRNILSKSLPQAFQGIEDFVLSILNNEEFKKKCATVTGETAALFVVRKGKYVWWLSVGDCLIFVLHPELQALGEVQLNHRSYYEWIGQVNTFDLLVPAYSRGIKELRNGVNHILLTTDGLIECPNEPFSHPMEIFEQFNECTIEQGVQRLLEEIEEQQVRDSTTILTWQVLISESATNPSNA